MHTRLERIPVHYADTINMVAVTMVHDQQSRANKSIAIEISNGPVQMIKWLRLNSKVNNNSNKSHKKNV